MTFFLKDPVFIDIQVAALTANENSIHFIWYLFACSFRMKGMYLEWGTGRLAWPIHSFSVLCRRHFFCGVMVRIYFSSIF